MKYFRLKILLLQLWILIKILFYFYAGDTITTPRRELAPPLEEDEEQDSESQRGAPLRQIENNISALLRGDIAVARVGGGSDSN